MAREVTFTTEGIFFLYTEMLFCSSPSSDSPGAASVISTSAGCESQLAGWSSLARVERHVVK
jgi:hypothetical protein